MEEVSFQHHLRLNTSRTVGKSDSIDAARAARAVLGLETDEHRERRRGDRDEGVGTHVSRSEASRLAKQILALENQFEQNQADLTMLVQQTRPRSPRAARWRTVSAATILTAWSHPGRVRSEAADRTDHLGRHVPYPGLVRGHDQVQTQSWRRSPTQQGHPHDRNRQDALPSKHKRLRRQTNRRRAEQEGNQALHHPANLPNAQQRRYRALRYWLECRDRLENTPLPALFVLPPTRLSQPRAGTRPFWQATVDVFLGLSGNWPLNSPDLYRAAFVTTLPLAGHTGGRN